MRKVVDTKDCIFCGSVMVRKTKKGPNKTSPKEWATKKYCSNKCKSEHQKDTNRGEGNPMWKAGKPKCLDCSKQVCNYNIKRCRGCYFKFNKGENHPNYKDGLHKQKYPTEFNAKLKLQIRTRDLFKCQLCYRLESEELDEFNRVLCVNHIDFNKYNCDPSNLNTLCLRCNLLINYDRDKWTNYFKQHDPIGDKF